MKPSVRRTLIFVGMMGIGLAVVLTVEDDTPIPVRKPAYGKVEATTDSAVTIRDVKSETETQVKLGEIVFNVTSTVELPDGRLENRKAYRIHILRGAPDEAGNFLVDGPHVTMLDLETGEDRGSVRADKGRFVGQQNGPAIGVFDPSSFDTRNFTLTGNVHGTWILEEGPPATFDGSELQVEGDDLFAPGEVVLASETFTLLGTDMSWKGTTRELRFEAVSEIRLSGDMDAVLESPRGLQWFATDGQDTRGYGTLFGPIKGQASNGSRVEGDRLELSDDAAAVKLVGDARYDILREGALWTLTADTVTARVLDAGGWEVTRAAGDVRLASEDATPPAWFETDQVDGLDQSLVALGPVRGQYGTFAVTCTGFRWNEPDGQLDLLADVVIDSLATDPDAQLSGAHVTSPGGVFLTTDVSGLRARFAGPVDGLLPGVGAFRCTELTYDEAVLEAVLVGSAKVDFKQADQSRELSGERIAITHDEFGSLAAVNALGQVVLVERDDAGHLLQRLAGPWLDVTPTLVSAPEEFDLYWNGFDVSGTGLTLDKSQGLFEIDRSAHIARTLDDGTSEWIDAEAGATWWLPDGAEPDPAGGHGEFRGPVSGRTADGILVSGDALVVNGAQRSLILNGNAVVDHPTEGRIESEQLDAVKTPSGLRVRSPVLVTLTGDRMSGYGTGLDFDQVTGHMSLDHDVFLRFVDEGGIAREISCDGAFTWTAPAGAVDPFMQGVGEFQDNVIGRDGEGGGFSADRLLVDMPRKQVELFGECRVQQAREGKPYSLTTEPSGYIRLEADALGEPLAVEATGRVELTADDMTLQGDEFKWDVAEDHVVLSGDCRLKMPGSWMSAPFVEVRPEAKKWFIPRNISKIDADL